MEMGFKQWLLEVSTSTGDVASFARPVLGMVRRYWPWTEEDPFFKKKRLVKEGDFSNYGHNAEMFRLHV